MNLLRKATILLLIIFFLVCSLNFASGNNSADVNTVKLMSNDALLAYNSLMKYEKYVSNFEDQQYGYSRENGYPMYLYTLGMMHYGLYYLNGDKIQYREKFLNTVDKVEKIKNNDSTWNYFNGKKYFQSPSALYNCIFSDMYLNAYKMTNDTKYLKYSENAVAKLPDFLFNSNPESVYNYYFQIFIAIAHYLDVSGKDNRTLKSAGKYAFDMAMKGYDYQSHKWFYSPKEYELGYYNGHSANYQMAQMENFLLHKQNIHNVFPSEYKKIYDELPNMIKTVIEYQLPSGAFYYNDSAPDSTETIGIVLSFLTLYDKEFQTDHSDNISKCIKTIVKRQAPSGAFYKTEASLSVEIWYGDDLASRIPIYLLNEKENIIKE